ncbi:heavy metal translocating P-type ATPase metal-binding domain-containing protein [Lentisphaera profundi]|uniref:Heavy metal translocating P-type ATPase metal-binding domain-containing protein n=1 Tax=Lentisphaera profundi TaxID=1658616 RepID=A0ABY7VP49_9BACT|nr:heavy metal translocating P-type ATPase metal-binding domain-containing protein [Lentisphaera profundi]WDE95732.1 heavy metal translocating P-type ATPase metal-binding domain-containing protein [Lentisphaera profundi]
MQTTAETWVSGIEESLFCRHCGDQVDEDTWCHESELFCCNGCLNVYLILSNNGLNNFYEMAEGVAGVKPSEDGEFDYLDDIVGSLALFESDDCVRIRFRIPSIHCISCVWLLEKLSHLNSGIRSSRVNFAKQDVLINYDPGQVKLSEVASLLQKLGYEPKLNLEGNEIQEDKSEVRKDLGKIAMAGFCCGNIMMMSFPAYFGLELDDAFARLFAYLNLFLCLPLVTYCSSDFWKAIPRFIKARKISLDLPIAVGIGVLFFQTVFDVLSQSGEGYADSLGGFVFFLLLGRFFQKVSYKHLSFERDFKSFFPLSVRVLRNGEAKLRPVQEVKAGDILLIRSGELLPVDGEVVKGEAGMDYSFVTGESEPVKLGPGENAFAGGRQKYGLLEIKVKSAVDSSYLASLWNDETFQSEKVLGEAEISQKAGVAFTFVVPILALIAAVYWAVSVDLHRGLEVLVAVLIVACPCALALSVPLAFGFSLRLLGKKGFFIKNAEVIEKMAQADSFVFDKTGTLSRSDRLSVTVTKDQMSDLDKQALLLLSSQSGHPKSMALQEEYKSYQSEIEIGDFQEQIGKGIEATIAGQDYQILADGNSTVFLKNGESLAYFDIRSAWRDGWQEALRSLKQKCCVLSGDHDRDRAYLEQEMPAGSEIFFQQKPQDKLAKIREMKQSHKSLVMFGDGLNDSGALREADVGVAIAENSQSFTPASDVIMHGDQLQNLGKIQAYMKWVMNLIRVSFVFSLLYNFTGLAFAVTGYLSPLTSAILMPLSSLTILFISALGTNLGAKLYLKKGH